MYRHSPSLFNNAICTERCACAGTIYSRLGPNGNSLSRTGVTAGKCFTRNCYCQPPCNTGQCHTGGTGSSGGSSSKGTPTSRSSSTYTPTSESSGSPPGMMPVQRLAAHRAARAEVTVSTSRQQLWKQLNWKVRPVDTMATGTCGVAVDIATHQST
jgi:hypothetical protein